LLGFQPGDGLRGFGCGGEDGFRVVLEELQPVGEILRVIGARVLRNAKLGAEKG